jgi:pyruvate dehydrogenase E1 component alpha subunit
LEHCGPNDDDDLGYRPLGELQTWRELDSVTKLGKLLESDYQISPQDLADLAKEIVQEIDLVFERVKLDRYPTIEESLSDVYAK